MPIHRLVIFCSDPPSLCAFYCEAFGFRVLANERTYIDTGPPGRDATRLAFHKGAKTPSTSIKISFYAADVLAERARLVGLGARMGKVRGEPGSLCFCDGRDAEGNVFSITNRA